MCEGDRVRAEVRFHFQRLREEIRNDIDGPEPSQAIFGSKRRANMSKDLMGQKVCPLAFMQAAVDLTAKSGA